MLLLEHRSASFIVRVWCEPDRAAESAANFEWRGSIEHLDSGRRSYFRELSAIVEFIRECIEDPAPADAPSPQPPRST